MLHILDKQRESEELGYKLLQEAHCPLAHFQLETKTVMRLLQAQGRRHHYKNLEEKLFKLEKILQFSGSS